MENQLPTEEEITQLILTQREKLASLNVARCEKTHLIDIDILMEFEPKNHTFDHFMVTAFPKA